MFLLLLVFIATITMFVLYLRYMGEGKKETARNLYLAIIGANVILFISIIGDINSNEFGFVSILKSSCLILDVIFTFCAPISAKIHSNQVNRILTAFDGELGDKLRTYLPIDAIVYTADTHAMTWQEENGDGRILTYSSLGFDRLPDNYEYVVCQWIRDNIVYDRENYHFESMTYESDRYEESNTATIKKTYTGDYEVTRNPGRYVTSQTTIGHALVHNGYDFEGLRVNTKPLKKW